jgi:hypothetical protein
MILQEAERKRRAISPGVSLQGDDSGDFSYNEARILEGIAQ